MPRLTIPNHPVTFEPAHKWVDHNIIHVAGWLTDDSFLIMPDQITVLIAKDLFSGDLCAMWKVLLFELGNNTLPPSRTRREGRLAEARFWDSRVCATEALGNALARQLWYANEDVILGLPDTTLSKSKRHRLLARPYAERFRYTLPYVDGGATVYDSLEQGQEAIQQWVEAGRPPSRDT